MIEAVALRNPMAVMRIGLGLGERTDANSERQKLVKMSAMRREAAVTTSWWARLVLTRFGVRQEAGKE
jgi:hypothetical protein